MVHKPRASADALVRRGLLHEERLACENPPVGIRPLPLECVCMLCGGDSELSTELAGILRSGRAVVLYFGIVSYRDMAFSECTAFAAVESGRSAFYVVRPVAHAGA